jgi:hypothetical protein
MASGGTWDGDVRWRRGLFDTVFKKDLSMAQDSQREFACMRKQHHVTMKTIEVYQESDVASGVKCQLR